MAYALATLSLTNEAKNSSSIWSKVVITAIPHKEMHIACEPSHVTQHYSHKNRKLQNRQPFFISFYPALLKIFSIVKKHINILQPSAITANKVPLIDQLLPKNVTQVYVISWSIHSELPKNKPFNQQPTEIRKCNRPRCLTCSFLQEGQTNNTLFTTKNTRIRKITDYISRHSKTLIYIYVIQRKKCHSQCIANSMNVSGNTADLSDLS